MSGENQELSPEKQNKSRSEKEIWDFLFEHIDKVTDEDIKKMKKRLTNVEMNPDEHTGEYLMILTVLNLLTDSELNRLIDDVNKLPDDQKILPGIHSLPSQITTINIIKYLENKNPAK